MGEVVIERVEGIAKGDCQRVGHLHGGNTQHKRVVTVNQVRLELRHRLA